MASNVISLLKSPIVWLLVMLVSALMWVGQMDYEDAVMAHQHYCSMVEDYKESNGDRGWPPYDPNIDCSDSNAR